MNDSLISFAYNSYSDVCLNAKIYNNLQQIFWTVKTKLI